MGSFGRNTLIIVFVVTRPETFVMLTKYLLNVKPQHDLGTDLFFQMYGRVVVLAPLH